MGRARRALAALRHPLAVIHPGEWDGQGVDGDLIARLRRWQRELDADLDRMLAEGDGRG